VLFSEVYQTYLERLRPILARPLLTGYDLIETLHLTPGPFFKEILEALLEERAVQPEMDKLQALEWARGYVVRHREV
ncbi:MAG: polynucleotide adenylyltransferase, partial [Desulfobulbaceae bacterium]|nr:polynucleotide adenylyltransferase [Desulfobulbaceae bacterium]